jgi:exodeoxyribonuclease VII large subunit
MMPPTETEFHDVELSVSDFVALHNQVLEYAMPNVLVVGEVSNFRVSKNRWVYFDLKDEGASVRFFGTVYQLSGPLEDGMVVKVRGTPRLHPQFGFSITVQNIQLAGEGTIRRAFDLLQAKLTKEGLFDPARKRALPYPPERIAVITSTESAAYADFVKVLGERWRGVEIVVANVQVQGEVAPAQIVEAIAKCNALAEPPEVIVITRGGGSSDDLWAFSTEQVTRAVAASRVPTLVAIGHEIDISLAELAADQRASTPSNAAELLVPDRRDVLAQLKGTGQVLGNTVLQSIRLSGAQLQRQRSELRHNLQSSLERQRHQLDSRRQMLNLLNPAEILQRGYAIVRSADGAIVRRIGQAQPNAQLDIQVADGHIKVEVQ